MALEEKFLFCYDSVHFAYNFASICAKKEKRSIPLFEADNLIITVSNFRAAQYGAGCECGPKKEP
jgi:hypothetical protein